MALDLCQDINARDVYGYTALYWASLMGHREVVLALLSDNATDVNKANSIGRTPLHAASANATPQERPAVNLANLLCGVPGESRDSQGAVERQQDGCQQPGLIGLDTAVRGVKGRGISSSSFKWKKLAF